MFRPPGLQMLVWSPSGLRHPLSILQGFVIQRTMNAVAHWKRERTLLKGQLGLGLAERWSMLEVRACLEGLGERANASNTSAAFDGE